MDKFREIDWLQNAERAGAALWVGLGLATMFLALFVMYVGSVAAPYWDQWGFVDPAYYLSHLFDRHNEHPIVIGRLFFAIDYFLFDARGWWLQAMTYLILIAEAAAFTWLAYSVGFRTRLQVLIAAGLSATALFNPHIWENIIWGFQVPFVLAFSSTVVGAAALSRHAETGGRTALGLAIACAAIAPLSLSNGLLTPLLYIAMAFVLHSGRKNIVVFAVIAAIAWTMYLLSSGAPSRPDSPGLLELPYIKLITYFGYYLGGGLANSLDYMVPFINPLPWERLSAAFFIGMAMTLASAWMLLHILFNPRRLPAEVALAAIVLFLLATAALTAYGRVSFSLDQALSPRYGVVGGALATSLIIWFAKDLMTEPVHRFRAVALVIAFGLVSATVPLASLQLVKNLTGQQKFRTSAIPALVVDVPDMERIGALAFNLEMAREASSHLKSAGKWHFESEWAQHMLEISPIPLMADRQCQGGAAIDMSWSDPSGARIAGYVPRSETLEGRIIVAADAEDRLVGYGLVGQRPSDLFPAQDMNEHFDWVGNIRLDIGAPPYRFFLVHQSSVICAFPATSNESAG